MTTRAAAKACLLVIAAWLPAAAHAQESAAGRWTGELQADGAAPIQVVVELESSATGEWQGTLLLADRQTEAAPLHQVSVGEDGVRFSTPYLPGAPSFSGALSSDGARLEGQATLDAPPPPPGSDIYLMQVDSGGDAWRLGLPVNITHRDGYDNQPRFLLGGEALLYTSIRDDQADIYRYEVSGSGPTRVTTTETSEYSPTPLPSGEGFSTVRVEDDGTQRLWRFDADGGSPALVLPDLRPVGYHGWLPGNRLALFVLGEPPTLVLATPGGETETVAESVGRSIHVTPDGSAVSFVHKASDDDWRIEILDLESRNRRTVIATRPGNEDFIWTPDGHLLMGDGSTLHLSSPGDEPPAWRQVADLSASGITGITRLAMSADGKHLAVVGERPAPDAAPERLSYRLVLTRLDQE